jgi:hypothetical protein
MRWALVLLVACAADDPCAPMCAAATDALSACLDADGLDWAAAGYADAADHRDACETWAWAQRQLARDAGGADVDGACAAREAELVDGGCDAYSAIDWAQPVWGGARSR